MKFRNIAGGSSPGDVRFYRLTVVPSDVGPSTVGLSGKTSAT